MCHRMIAEEGVQVQLAMAMGIELGMWIGRGLASPGCVPCVVSDGVHAPV